MKKIINFFLTVLIFWLGMTYFSEYIQINNTQTLLIASLLMFALDLLFIALMYVSMLTSVIAIGCLPFIIGIIVLPFLDFIKLYYMSKYLSGFYINGFWTYILLVAALSIFKLRDKSSSENNKKSE
jgi:hypothetical protein